MKSTELLQNWFIWTLAALGLGYGSVEAFDFYLPVEEVSKLLGLNKELWYVVNGNVKRNAVDFSIPMSQELDEMHFVWNTDEHNLKLPYSIRITTSDPVALHQPHLNISHSGYLPTTPTVWRVRLPCSQLKSGSVTVTVDISVGDKEIKLTRKKNCASNVSFEKDILAEKLDTRTPPHHVFYAIVFGTLIVIIFLALGIVGVRARYQKVLERQAISQDGQRSEAGAESAKNFEFHRNQYPEFAQEAMHNHPFPLGPNNGTLPFSLPYQTEERPFTPNSYRPPLPPPNPVYQEPQLVDQYGGPSGIMSDAESRVTDWIQQQHLPKNQAKTPEAVLRMIEFEKSRLNYGLLILEGTFGRVYQGTILKDDDDIGKVLLKTVVEGASKSQIQTMISEGISLFGLTHNHILPLIASSWDNTSPVLVYPFTSFGNLKKWLLQTCNQTGFSTHFIVNLALQMLKAMQHLHKRKIIHKDIATRNCFLDEGNVLKLADSALSRDLFPGDYHCLGDNENRPIKWMPVEAIGQKKYSRASDVWSFGVFLWELMTRGQQPFSDIDPFEMESYLLEGFRLHQPTNCPDQLYSILTSCWGARAHERNSVHVLYGHLQALQKQLQQFV